MPLISGLGRSWQFPVRAGGLVEIPTELREICAVFETGRVPVAGPEINGRESISVGDGKTIIACLFDARDEGSGHTARRQHDFRSFSITPGHTIPLPGRIRKIRGQTGLHVGDAGLQEHMVLRIAFRDNRAVAGFDELGFDPLVIRKNNQRLNQLFALSFGRASVMEVSDGNGSGEPVPVLVGADGAGRRVR